MRIVAIFILLAVIPAIRSEDLYFSHSGGGLHDGSSGNEWSVTEASTLGNWGTGAGKIGPGDTLHVVGTITSQFVVRGSGTIGNVITILFDPGAKFSAPFWTNTGAMKLFNGASYITIDGGATGLIGGPTGNAAFVNGIIEATDNGDALTYQQDDSAGIYGTMWDHCTVKNLAFYNIYVRSVLTAHDGGDTFAINIQHSAAGTQTELLFENILIHNVFAGINLDYGAGDSNYTLNRVTAYNVNWGGKNGDRGATSTFTGMVITNCHFHSFSNWDDTVSNIYHHNGFYGWAESGGTFHSIYCSGNVIGPGFGSYTTGGLYFSGANGTQAGPATFINNLFLESDSADHPQNGQITYSGSDGSTALYANNTISGGGGGIGFKLSGLTGGTRAFTFKNNIIIGKTAIDVTYSGSFSITATNNLCYNLTLGQNYGYSTTSSGSFKTVAQWQSLGFDLDLVTSDPDLTAEYMPDEGSPAIAAGADLSAYFTTDAAGVSRVFPWDMGAYKSDSSALIYSGQPLAGGFLFQAP